MTDPFTQKSEHARDLRSEVYPPIRDWEAEEVSPAEDGHPWRKACKECAFRWHTEAQSTTGMTEWEATSPNHDRVFYCTHRIDENGRHRVCACYAACRAGSGLGPPSGELIPDEELAEIRASGRSAFL